MRDNTALTTRIARYAALLSLQQETAADAVAQAIDIVAVMRGPRPRSL